MFKKILLGLLAVLVLAVATVLLLATTKPDELRVERSEWIAAPPQVVFPHLDDLHAWKHWSAYETKDPGMTREYGGAARGVGAWYAWDGNGDVGSGRMEIVESQPPQRLRIRLDFSRPFEASNLADFTLTPEGGGTRVTWVMHGPALYITKVMQVLFDMDAMIGRDFEVGLASLKTRVESGASSP